MSKTIPQGDPIRLVLDDTVPITTRHGVSDIGPLASAAQVAALADQVSPTTLSVGDGTGSPTIVLSKSAAGTAQVEFRAAGVIRARVQIEGDEDLVISVHDASGVVTGSLTYSNGTGNVVASGLLGAATLQANALTIFGVATLGGGIAATLPTHADNAAAVAAELAVGRLYKTATGEVRIVV